MAGCILGSQYIPSVEYFAHWLYHGQVWMERCEHYQKRTWRNKTAILGPDAPVFLTVPLAKGKHQQMMITDVRVSYEEPWHKIHLNSIKTAYGKSAFFEELFPDLENIITDRPEKLWDLNMSIIRLITSVIPMEWSLELTTTFHPQYASPVVDLRSGVPSGQSSLEPGPALSYSQVQRIHKSHQPNLSIFDVLFHLGPGAAGYLTRYAAKLYDLP